MTYAMVLLKVGLNPASTTPCRPIRDMNRYQSVISAGCSLVSRRGRTTTTLIDLDKKLPHVIYVGEFHTRMKNFFIIVGYPSDETDAKRSRRTKDNITVPVGNGDDAPSGTTPKKTVPTA